MLASQERLVTQSTWTRSGVLRLRREIQVQTRTIEVTVRREVLTVEYDDYFQPVNGVLPGTVEHSTVAEPPLNRPGLTIVLREEIPSVVMETVPYEVVTAHTSRVTTDRTISERLAREQVVVETTAGSHGPDGAT